MRLPVMRRAVSRRPKLAAGVRPSGTCISATISNGKACINTPIGSKCVSVPSSVPNGTVAKVCADICKKWGIPCGAEVTVSVAGQQVASEGFGCC